MSFQDERRLMVETQLKKRGIRDPRVLEAMGRVPRQRFVPPELMSSAYEDNPLAIEEGQTISQPYMVAFMTECLELQGKEKVLEVGTGSGYQTAILAELVEKVFTMEIHGSLSVKAEALLFELGYGNIEFRIGDGSKGLEEEAPYDGILVTAGSPEIPDVLKNQLANRGRLVIPAGSRFVQTLYRVTRINETFHKEELTSCVFVPLIGEHGWRGE